MVELIQDVESSDREHEPSHRPYVIASQALIGERLSLSVFEKTGGNGLSELIHIEARGIKTVEAFAQFSLVSQTSKGIY